MSVGAGVIAGMPDADPPELTPVRKKKKFKVLRRRLMGEAGIVKIGKQFASHRIKTKKKTLLQKVKQKIQDKIKKPDRGDVIYMNTEEKKITTKARGNGFHDVLVDGEKHPHVEIVNGSGGVSGYGRNVYGVHYSRLNKTRWIGSLQKTKRHIEKALNESGPLSGKPKKLKPLTPKKLEPLAVRVGRINKRGAGSPGAVKIKDWLADKKRRVAVYKKEREERMKERERRDENT